ncbi:MAG TPA: hypothetical protein VGE39_16500 [Prosthecobacter sp.]
MRTLLILLLALLATHHVGAQQLPPQPSRQGLPATLAFELAEYDAKRADGLNRLAQMAKAQLEVVRKDQMEAGNLEGTNATLKAMSQLPVTSLEKADPPEGAPSDAVLVFKDHTRKVFAGITGLNAQFIPRIEKVKVELLKSGDLAGANAADALVKQMRSESEQLQLAKEPVSGAKTEALTSFTVEALIDGGSELHVTKDGIQWVVPGGEAKPGLHVGSNEATYVNGARWKPKWKNPGERGPDTSDVYPLKTTAPKLVSETVLVSKERFGKHEERTPVATSVKDGHFVVTIRDPEGGSRWYKVRIKTLP